MKTLLVIAGIFLCLSACAPAYADDGGGDGSDDPQALFPADPPEQPMFQGDPGNARSSVPELPYEEPEADRVQREGKSRDVYPESGTIIQNQDGTQRFCFSDGSGGNFCQ